MVKQKKCYILTVGESKKLYIIWLECKEDMKGVSGATCKGYNTEEEARKVMEADENKRGKEREQKNSMRFTEEKKKVIEGEREEISNENEVDTEEDRW